MENSPKLLFIDLEFNGMDKGIQHASLREISVYDIEHEKPILNATNIHNLPHEAFVKLITKFHGLIAGNIWVGCGLTTDVKVITQVFDSLSLTASNQFLNIQDLSIRNLNDYYNVPSLRNLARNFGFEFGHVIRAHTAQGDALMVKKVFESLIKDLNFDNLDPQLLVDYTTSIIASYHSTSRANRLRLKLYKGLFNSTDFVPKTKPNAPHDYFDRTFRAPCAFYPRTARLQERQNYINRFEYFRKVFNPIKATVHLPIEAAA